MPAPILADSSFPDTIPCLALSIDSIFFSLDGILAVIICFPPKKNYAAGPKAHSNILKVFHLPSTADRSLFINSYLRVLKFKPVECGKVLTLSSVSAGEHSQKSTGHTSDLFRIYKLSVNYCKLLQILF